MTTNKQLKIIAGVWAFLGLAIGVYSLLNPLVATAIFYFFVFVGFGIIFLIFSENTL